MFKKFFKKIIKLIKEIILLLLKKIVYTIIIYKYKIKFLFSEENIVVFLINLNKSSVCFYLLYFLTFLYNCSSYYFGLAETNQIIKDTLEDIL